MALGVKVIINKKNRIYNNRKEIHIANHESPLDALITQGYFCMPSLTTAHLHISKILLGIEFVITKYGHIPFDYKNNKSRIKALYLTPEPNVKNFLPPFVACSKKYPALIANWSAYQYSEPNE